MKLQLNRPLCAFDIESTGKDPLKAKIIELAIVKLWPDGTRDTYLEVFNPGENISEENAAIHGFTNEAVKDKPLFKEGAPDVIAFIAGCDLCGFNSNAYDIPLLNEEIARAGLVFDFSNVDFVDVGVLYKVVAQRTLSAAVLTYLGKSHDGAHGALEDTIATIDVLDAMFTAHPNDIVPHVPELALKSNYGLRRLDLAGKFKYRADGVEIFTFGKHKDEPLLQNLSYLKWMQEAKQSGTNDFSFSLDTRNVIAKYLAGNLTIEQANPKASTYSNPHNRGGSYFKPEGYKGK